MREILFRGKRVDNGEWVYGGVSFLRGISCLITIYVENNNGAENKEILIIPETLGQYTGLKDKNGTKIFEGDIVISTSWCEFIKDNDKDLEALKRKCVVEYNNGQLCLVEKYEDNSIKPIYWNWDNRCKDELEIIGNIHDNPELLEGV